MYGGVILPDHKNQPLRQAARMHDPAPVSDLTFGDLAIYVWQGRSRILLVALIASLLSIGYLGGFSENSYRAVATVRLDPKDVNVVEVQAVQDRAATDVFLLNTELRVIQSHAILEQVVDQLDLQSNPSFNTAPFLKDLLAQIRARLTGLSGDKGFPALPQDRKRPALDALRNALDIRLIRETYIVEIRAETGDPRLSAKIANTLAQTYTGHQLKEKLQATQDAADWLDSELDGLSVDLLLKDREIAGLRAALESTSETDLELDTREIRSMRARLEDLYKERSKVLDRIAQPDGTAGDSPPPSQADSAAGYSAAGYSTVQQAQFAARLARFDQQIAALESTLETLMSGLSVRAVDLNRLKELERDQSRTEDMHERFSNRLRETVLQFGLVRPDARILSLATVPNQPSGPKWLRTIALATGMGAAAAALVIILINLIIPKIQSSRDWTRITDLPLLAQLPSVRAIAHRRGRAGLVIPRTAKPAPYLAELRMRLTRQLDRPHGIISISAHSRKSRYSALSAGLAASFADTPQARVLLVDLDSRSSGLAGLVPSEPARIDLDILLNTPEKLESLRELQQQTNGFDVIYAGTANMLSVDLMAGGRMANLLRVARQRYDWIIVNLPPVASGAIVPMAADLGDYLLYVVHRKSRQARILQDLDYIRKDIACPAGSVLTDVKGANGFALPTTHSAFLRPTNEEPVK